jgi:hypothetical protein
MKKIMVPVSLKSSYFLFYRYRYGIRKTNIYFMLLSTFSMAPEKENETLEPEPEPKSRKNGTVPKDWL